MSDKNDSSQGFTLIELVTVLAVMTILALLGLPALRELMSSQRLAVASHALVSSLNYARSEAIRRNAVVTVCPSKSQSGCEAGIAWSQGWIVFADLDGDGQAGIDEPVLRTTTALLEEPASSSSLSHVSYRPDGKAWKPSGALQFGSIYLCGSQRAKRIVLSASGRVRLENSQCL